MRTTLRGAKLGWEERGRGVPLVLLHAFPLDRRMWAHTAEALALEARVLTLDFRGLGESEAPMPPSIDAAADDAAALLDHLGVERAVVGGLSMGGYASLAFARRHPQRLLGLVLADTRAGADSPAQRTVRDEGIARIAREGSRAYVDELVPRFCAARSHAARAQALALAQSQPPLGVAGALAALRDRPDSTPTLAAIAVPTLVLVGAEDTLTPPDEARRLAAGISGAEQVELPGAGHLANLESPEPFVTALRGFLSRFV